MRKCDYCQLSLALQGFKKMGGRQLIVSLDLYHSWGMSIELKGDCRDKNRIIDLPDFSIVVFL